MTRETQVKRDCDHYKNTKEDNLCEKSNNYDFVAKMKQIQGTTCLNSSSYIPSSVNGRE
jgi:hypothetical protein